MAIDIGALRKFQETWAPVMDAIPAVVEMVERKADMEREVNAHRAKMDKAQAEIQKAYDVADERIAQFNSDVTKLQEQKAALEADIAAARVAADEAATAAQAKAAADLAAVEKQIVQATARLGAVESTIAERTSAAQAKHEEALKLMAAEISELERRKAQAEKALDLLRAKLG